MQRSLVYVSTAIERIRRSATAAPTSTAAATFISFSRAITTTVAMHSTSRPLIQAQEQSPRSVDLRVQNWVWCGPETVQIITKSVAPVIAQKHSIGVQHRHHLETGNQ